MKNYIKYALLLLMMISFVACSSKAPSFRVSNERTSKVNLQIKTTNNTININDVQPGELSAYRDVAEGPVAITAVIQNDSNTPTNGFNAQKDKNYTIVILNTNPPSIRIDVSDK